MAMNSVYPALVFVCIFSLPKAGGSQSVCRPGWSYYNSACWRGVRSSRQPMIYQLGQNHCKAMGAKLASIHSQEEQDFLTNTFAENNPNFLQYGIGLYRPTTNDPLPVQWTDGTNVTYTNWNNITVQPDLDGLYTIMGSGGRWKLRRSGEEIDGYICKINPGDQDWSLPPKRIFAGAVPKVGSSAMSIPADLAIVEHRTFRGGAARCAVLCAVMPGCRGFNFGGDSPLCQLLTVNIKDDGMLDAAGNYYLIGTNKFPRHYYLAG